MNGEFGKLVERERKKKWLSSKQFHKEKKIDCTYPRYTVIENGRTPFASLKLAQQIIKALNIDESRALHAWVRDLMPPDKKAYFVDLNEDYYSSRLTTIVIDDEEKKYFFERSPLYKELSVYISMFSDRGVTFDELQNKFNIKKQDLMLILNQLKILGILAEKNRKFVVPAGSWLTTPNTEEFRKAVSVVFADAVNSHFSGRYIEGESFEHSTLRLVDKELISELHLRLKNIARWFTVQPDKVKNGIPFRFFAGANYAVFGENKNKYIPWNLPRYIANEKESAK